ncbi:hypothetical protein HY993_00045 [Candidatus Micrarchaeota archaeon]|nr:hypothetical protein [Candidatus Micrarchaeota archaeon]
MTFYTKVPTLLGRFLERENLDVVKQTRDTLHVRVTGCHWHKAAQVREHLKQFGLKLVKQKLVLNGNGGNHELVFKPANPSAKINLEMAGSLNELTFAGRVCAFFGALKHINPYTNQAFKLAGEKGWKVRPRIYVKKLVPTHA